jgi:hypothetical protein
MANEIPQFSDSRAEEQTQIGARLLRQQSEGRPRFSFPDISGRPSVRNTLLNALIGAQQGSTAALDAARLGDPTAAALAGALGGFAGAAQRPAEQLEQQMLQRQAQLQMAELELTPIEQISPAIVARFPFLEGTPMGMVNRISPLVTASERTLAAKEAFNQNAALRRELEQASPAVRAFVEASLELAPGTIQKAGGLKKGEVGSLLAAQKPLSAEILKVKTNVDDGTKSLESALKIFDRASESTRKKSAVGGIAGRALRIGDEDAQELNRLVSVATDVITRQRTGAALNEAEQEFYSSLVNDVTRTSGQNRKAMEDLLLFYRKVSTQIEDGRRRPGQKFAAFLNVDKLITDRAALREESSGEVTIQGPDGRRWTIPASQLAAAEARGARRVQ